MCTYFNPRSPRGKRLSTRAWHWRTCPNFNPHSPQGERHLEGRAIAHGVCISIHAPHGGSDSPSSSVAAKPTDFNPRSPWGGATLHSHRVEYPRRISIHSPRGGERPKMGAIIISSTYFNPRSPRGERRSVSVRHVQLFIFQSTLPAGGATCLKLHRCLPRMKNFNPRSPRGERRLFATRRHMLQ